MSGGRDVLYSYVATENDHTVESTDIKREQDRYRDRQESEALGERATDRSTD